ncbi:hypothetical protein [Lentilactobacillus parabuchneri]|uniref:hypothetical protein n=1 Tax=Lentilactobacillus parabuchneri TaxID=152331 RepID=UPI002307D56B|nr:hypothetical protein [Lentilactobacillus parabuchneri]MDB1104623.1 hypothetical protein [Lentilactobacillus parabuchneri]
MLITISKEKQRIQQLVNLDNQTDQKTNQQVDQTLTFIKSHLYEFYQHYADENGITVATAAGQISAWDKQQWEKAVSEVDITDWPQEATKRGTVLSALAGIDKSNLWGAIAGLSIIKLTVQQLNAVNHRLELDTSSEIKRMKANFKIDPQNLSKLEKATNQSIAESAKTGWSPNLWEQNDEMVADVQKLVNHAMKHGMTAQDIDKLLAKHENPSQFKPGQSIADRIQQSQFNMRRIVRSESAIAKYKINMATYKQQGYAMVDWITEPGACDKCQSIADDGPYDIDNAPEVVNDSHPNCRCSVIPYVDTWKHTL